MIEEVNDTFISRRTLADVVVAPFNIAQLAVIWVISLSENLDELGLDPNRRISYVSFRYLLNTFRRLGCLRLANPNPIHPPTCIESKDKQSILRELNEDALRSESLLGPQNCLTQLESSLTVQGHAIYRMYQYFSNALLKS